MIKNLIESWKQDWLEKNKEALRVKFQYDMEDLKKSLDTTLSQCKEKLTKLEEDVRFKELELNLKKAEFEEKSKQYDERKVVLAEKQKELDQMIKLLEAKASPTHVWSEAFALGVDKSMDIIIPIITAHNEKLMNKFKEDAALEAINRLKRK